MPISVNFHRPNASTKAQAARATYPLQAAVAIVSARRIGYADTANAEAKLGQDLRHAARSRLRKPGCLSRIPGETLCVTRCPEKVRGGASINRRFRSKAG